MGIKLEWEKLLAEGRVRESSTQKYAKMNIDDPFYDHRNEFDKDYDRIVYSSSVRRLQDKAQVFPLQENDFTRTRLTHSIEASALARSFGYAVGEWLLETREFKDFSQIRKLSAMLQVAALIHDLGNPPFGHYGESIIREWFSKLFNTEEFKSINMSCDGEKELSNEEKKDFILFEGNAQTLRIVSKLQMLNDEYGVNFTFGTLATIMKYPWNSQNELADSKKKFGYFLSEKELAKKIFEATGIQEGIKHPATYLLEASDDIAYLNADIEDGVKKGIIPWEKEYNLIKTKLMEADKETYEYIFKTLDSIKEKSQEKGIPNDDLIAVQNFKIFSQGLMFKSVVKCFKDNYTEIMCGEFSGDLLEKTNCKLLVEELKRLAGKYCFSNKEVIALELVGDNVINGLLDKFVIPLIKCKAEPKSKTYEGKIYSLFSNNFIYICLHDTGYEGHQKDFAETSIYERLLLVTDYISGMTDSYAVNLYKQLIGVRLP
ncbi:dGTP triphosphohydrolase [Acetobacterium sp.]|uniref:dGTP triphosphohydrolase n=1 Tax=Acetobacterium sp. TaxID=1872094 RepID=UPI0035942C39